jgi:hypothetical protein
MMLCIGHRAAPSRISIRTLMRPLHRGAYPCRTKAETDAAEEHH